MKGSILFISKHAQAASTRYRIFQYIEFLEDLGWSCSYHAANHNSIRERLSLLRKCSQYDIVVIQRKLFDSLNLSLITRSNPNLVFDYDDAIFLNDDGSRSNRRHQRFIRTTKASVLAFAGNRYLANHSACSHTEIIPTSIVFQNYKHLSSTKRDTSGNVTLVWIGSCSTKKYLEQHRDFLEAIGSNFDNIELKIISDFELTFENLSTRCIPWSKEKEISELMSADIGIAPMTDDPWTRGKCGLKVIQYMACGIPVISSNCGANSEIILHNKTGFLASNVTDWINAIDRLQDAQLRKEMGEKGIARVNSAYSAEALSVKMDQLFTGILTHQD